MIRHVARVEGRSREGPVPSQLYAALVEKQNPAHTHLSVSDAIDQRSAKERLRSKSSWDQGADSLPRNSGS